MTGEWPVAREWLMLMLMCVLCVQDARSDSGRSRDRLYIITDAHFTQYCKWRNEVVLNYEIVGR